MSKTYEKVNHPDHYQSENIEAIDVIEAFNLNFSLGSAVKYILRAGKKPSETATEDLRKAVWYLQREKERLKAMTPLRYSIPIDNIDKINIKIEVLEKMITFYQEYLEREGEYEYVEERVQLLTSQLCEYLFAREFAKEGAKTFGEDHDLYAKVEESFNKHYPQLTFIKPKREDSQ